jgi:excisionase family DNA binding protein
LEEYLVLPNLRTVQIAGQPATNGHDPAWLTLGQACRILNVDESTLRRWADAGQVRTFRTPGGHRRFAEGDVRAIVQGRERPGVSQVGDFATRRIRQQLHSRGTGASVYESIDEEHRERLRPLGRKLMALVADYVAKRGKRQALLEEARATGEEYGAQLADAGMSLSQAMYAFTFFRRSLDQSAKQALAKAGTAPQDSIAACEQIMSLADQVLLGIAMAYEHTAVEA